VALVAAVLLVVADFSEISRRTIGIGACGERVDPGVCRTTGHDSHAFVLVILAPVALVMAWGAVVGRSRAAAVAVAALGVVVLFIALAIDLPKLDDKRGLDVLYDARSVEAHTGPAFKLELTGGVLLLLAGGLAFVRTGSEAPVAPRRPRERRRRRRASASNEPGQDATRADRAEARARERARRRASRSGGLPSPAEAEPPPEPKPSDVASAPPPPPPEAPTEAAPDESADLSAEAYRKPDPEPEPPEAPTAD
jgi:hypothetical protein